MATCKTKDEIIAANGKVINNLDGTVSVFIYSTATSSLAPLQLTKVCCEALGQTGNPSHPAYTFNETTQKCVWSTIDGTICENNAPFNIILNPKGNDGAIFNSVPDETCILNVSFDYLFRFSGSNLSDLFNTKKTETCEKITDVFENISASMSVNVIKENESGTYLEKVYTEEIFKKIGKNNLYNYLNGKSATTGFYITCSLENGASEEPINLYNLTVNNSVLTCAPLVDQIIDNLFIQSGLARTAENNTNFKNNIAPDSFASKWLNFNTKITNQVVIDKILNEKIKLSIQLTSDCANVCVMFDNIQLNKECTSASKKNIFVTKSPGFELDKIIDNKKSWVSTTTRENRDFYIAKYNDTQQIRNTNYLVDDERQVINTKEIDLDIDIASAVETDVWCYISDNPCLLTGSTIGTTTCIKDASTLSTATTSVTAITVTGFTAITSYTVTTAITSTTITIPITSFGCPIGYTATTGTNPVCQRIERTEPINHGTGAPIPPGDINGVFSAEGAYFYPEIPSLTSTTLPYKYPGNGTLQNALGQTVTPVVINATNTFWSSRYTSTNGWGRLNNIGLRAPDNSVFAGFSYCLEITTPGTYYIGLAADNFCRFKINSKLIANFNSSNVETFKKWSIFPVSLSSGKYLIEMEGSNEGTWDGQNTGSFGAEIYYPTGATPFATLTAATSTGASQANVIFTTATKVGENFDIGTNVGYECPNGYSLDLCGAITGCSKILTQPLQTTISYSSRTDTGYSFTTATTITRKDLTGVTATTKVIPAYKCLPKTYCCSEYCGDANVNIQGLLTQSLSDAKTIEDFEYYLTSELIDVKNRKIINSYATLKLLYDRYMNSLSYCKTNSSKFDYYKMEKFANLIGNYWIDLIEQVVPATTIWGATRIYSNTLFDNQKFTYKSYSSFFGTNNHDRKDVLSPASGDSCNASATTTVILGSSSETQLFLNQGDVHNYSNVYLVQMNSGSEFISLITMPTPPSPCGEPGAVVENPLGLTITTSMDNGKLKLTANPSNTIGDVTYLWSPTNETTQSITNVSAGTTYTVTIQDRCFNKSASYKPTCNLAVTTSTKLPTSSVSTDGSITATTTGQIGSLSYLWSNGQTTQVATGLSAGSYTVTVTDNGLFNCSVEKTQALSLGICLACNLGFSNYKTTSISRVNVGLLTGSCQSSITDYVIEWYGPNNLTTVAFTSGYGSLYQSEYQYQQPLLDSTNNSIPVEFGVYQPVIKRLKLNSGFYQLTGATEKTCLPTTTITPYTCLNRTNNNTDPAYSAYQHNIKFTTTTNLSPAPITATFEISASTKLVPIKFNAENVPDRLTIKLSGASYPMLIGLEDIVVGGNLPASNFSPTVFPKSAATQFDFTKILCLTGLTINNSDKLLITVTPAERGTNWNLYFGCLDTFEYMGVLQSANHKILTNTIQSLVTSCTNKIEFQLTSTTLNNFFNDKYYKYISNYDGIWGVRYSNVEPYYFNTTLLSNWRSTNLLIFGNGNTLFNDSVKCSIQPYYEVVQCTSSSSEINYKVENISGKNVFTVSSTSASDISAYYTNWVSTLATMGYNSNPTNLNYYKRIILNIPNRAAPDDCITDPGGQTPFLGLTVHPSSNVVTGQTGSKYWFKLSTETITNQTTYTSCDVDCLSLINESVNYINYASTATTSNASYTFTSNNGRRAQKPFCQYYGISQSTTFNTGATVNGYIDLYDQIFNTYPFSGTSNTLIPSLSGKSVEYTGGITVPVTYANIGFDNKFYKHYLKIELSNPSNIADFKIYASPITNGVYSGYPSTVYYKPIFQRVSGVDTILDSNYFA